METREQRLNDLAAILDQKARANPNHPSATRMARDVTTFRAMERRGADQIAQQQAQARMQRGKDQQ